MTATELAAVIGRIDRILVEQFEIPPARLTPLASLRDDLEFDSLDGLDLVVAIEKEFGFRVDDKLVLEMKTVGDIHDYVRKMFVEREQQQLQLANSAG